MHQVNIDFQVSSYLISWPLSNAILLLTGFDVSTCSERYCISKRTFNDQSNWKLYGFYACPAHFFLLHVIIYLLVNFLVGNGAASVFFLCVIFALRESDINTMTNVTKVIHSGHSDRL